MMAGHIRKRTYKRKDGTKREIWRARYPDPTKGGTAQIEKSFPTRRDAEKWLTDKKHSVNHGIHIDDRKRERLLREVVEGWRMTWGNLSENTRLGYHYTLNKHIIGTEDAPARFYGAQVGALSGDVIQDWVNELAETHTPQAVARIYTVLRSVLKFAVRRKYIADNPCNGGHVTLPKKTAKPGGRPMMILSPGEVRALAEAMGPYRVPVYVAAWCGLRAGELWALRRRDVDPAAGTIRVEWALKEVTGAAGLVAGLAVGPPKTKESRRRVSVPAPIMAMLVEHLDTASAPGPKGHPVIKTKGEDHAELSWTEDAADPDRLLFTTPVRPPKDADRWGAVGGYPIRHGQFYKRVFRVAVEGARPSPRAAYAPGTAPAYSRPTPRSRRRYRRRSTAFAGTTSVTPARASVSPSRRTSTSSRSAWATRTSA
jgi:integrase